MLEHRFTELKAQVRQAQQLSAMGLATATIAHEFSNLLSPVLAYVQYALDTDDAALSRKALSVTAKNVRVLTRMSDRLLEVGAAKAPDHRHVLVRAAVDEAVETLCRDLSKDGLTFVNEVPESLTAWAEPLHLHQVFFNLLLNARDAMVPRRSGCIRAAAEAVGDRVRITVSDNGPGIDPDRLTTIFDPLQSSKKDVAGRTRCGGLGLALCRDLIEEDGGSITVESTPDQGTAFHIQLPARAPAA
jgi:signal transduction histidine kinase